MNKNELKYISITRNWGGTKVRKEYDTKIDKWLNQFEESEKDIILELLKHFKYYTSRKLNKAVINLYQTFIETYGENADKVVFIPVHKDFGVGFSDEFFNKFWISNNIKDSAEKNIYQLLEQGNNFDKIAILDDYSGSGKTIKRTIQKCIDLNLKCKDTIFYVLVIQISISACERIKNFAKDQGIEIRIINLKTEEKAFENESIFTRDVSDKKKDEYFRICINHNINKEYILGFDKTQALISFKYNTPNNTLGIFWSEGDDFFAIFKRHKVKETTLSNIQKDAKRRKNERSKGIIKNHNEDERYIFLMAYLVNKGLDFNYIDACIKFGMSEEQMDDAIGYLLSNKYVSLAGGKINPTEKLKQVVTITKIKQIKDNKIDENTDNFVERPYIPRSFEKVFSGY